MIRGTIVVPDDFPPVLTGTDAEAKLRALDRPVRIFTERGADDEAELIRRIADAECVVNIRAHAQFTSRVIDACSNLRMISVWGSGTDHVDLTACARRGITVANTPGVNAHAVAEHTMALMLSIMRRIPQLHARMRSGEWPRGLSAQLEGKTLGIVGLGAIGSRVAGLARAFGMKLLITTAGADRGRAAALGARHVSLDELLRESDVVSLHLRLNADTRGILGRAQLALLEPTAYLVNTARGALVDRDALLDALQHERIAGAGLDVFDEEPLPAGDPLRSLPNVVLTSHNAGVTPEVIAEGLRLAVENVRGFLDGAPA
ncbi:MAG TPA: phosphoglycerate dehydrogenase [Gemmatimonadaceae bacterium]|nr:phosphoglycerate dehydrogenase [Gemmatimonadaceae bacterium]